jgi:hypothetical protein
MSMTPRRTAAAERLVLVGAMSGLWSCGLVADGVVVTLKVWQLFALFAFTALAVVGGFAAVTVVSSHGSSPSQESLLVNAARSLSGARSVRLDGAAKVAATQRGEQQGGAATIRGGISKGAVSLAGAVKLDTSDGKQTLPFGLRMTSQKLYVQLMGAWYSSSTTDLKQRASAAADSAAGTDKKSSQSLLEKLRTLMAANDIAAHAFIGEVSHGPELDGSKTWQWQGTLDPEGALAMAAKYGGAKGRLSAAEREKAQTVLQQLAALSSITVVAGTDGKPRRLEIKLDANKAELAALDKASGEDAGGDLSELHASVRFDLTHWNKPVEVVAPSAAKPIEQLLAGMLEG